MSAAPEYLTVPELAALLRVKERKVYDLAAAGAVPCSRATGKLLFPAVGVRAWIAARSTGPAPAAPRPAVFLGSHDPLLDWALRQSGAAIASFFDGSLDGLRRFSAGAGIATGLHLRDPGSGTWNVPAVAAECGAENAVLVAWARRSRGLILATGATGIAGLGDLAGRRVVPRQPEAGSQILFDGLLDAAGLRPGALCLTETARSETDAAEAVAEGRAEAGFGLAALARRHGLRFLPLAEERFDLLIDRAAWFDAPMQRFLTFARSPALAARASALSGYDITGLGEVVWNA